MEELRSPRGWEMSTLLWSPLHQNTHYNSPASTTDNTPHKLDIYNWNLNIVHMSDYDVKVHLDRWRFIVSCQKCLGSIIRVSRVSVSIYLLMLLKSEGHCCDWQLMFAPRWRYIASINSFTQHIRVFNLSFQWIEMNHNVCFTFDSQSIKMHFSL